MNDIWDNKIQRRWKKKLYADTKGVLASTVIFLSPLGKWLHKINFNRKSD